MAMSNRPTLEKCSSESIKAYIVYGQPGEGLELVFAIVVELIGIILYQKRRVIVDAP